ncbi:hypothetical protein [Streptomyces sp. SGAir0957]
MHTTQDWVVLRQRAADARAASQELRRRSAQLLIETRIIVVRARTTTAARDARRPARDA